MLPKVTGRIAGLLALGLALAPLPGLAQSVEDEVTQAYTAFDEAFNAGDASVLAEAYAEDALFLPATHDVIEGRDGIQSFFDGILGMGVTNHRLELIQAHEAGDSVVAAARWTADGKDEAGATQPWSGIATHVFRRNEDGDLDLRLHTFN
jgi:uncharacterized protein (TIGR02246 family)